MKKLIVLLATAVIIASTYAVLAAPIPLSHGLWHYGANIISGTYSHYYNYSGHRYYSATAQTRSGTTKKVIDRNRDGDVTARARRNYHLLGGNSAYYNYSNSAI